MKKEYIVEAIGTFILTLVVALSADPIAVGAVLIAMVYSFGYISGAHFNPAVTFAVYQIKKIKKEDAVRYVASQMAGAFLAAAAISYITNKTFYLTPSVKSGFWKAFSIEAIFTFLLVTVVLNTAVSEEQKNNQFYGAAIGLTIMAAALAGGEISGGAFNPAVGVSPLLFDMANISYHITSVILYIAGPMTGAYVASKLFRMK